MPVEIGAGKRIPDQFAGSDVLLLLARFDPNKGMFRQKCFQFGVAETKRMVIGNNGNGRKIMRIQKSRQAFGKWGNRYSRHTVKVHQPGWVKENTEIF